ncbi:Eco57I restriction-modification methylase domain-containing protein [Simplicispira suum]|uniref:site-specific DNA-methyltransferase (adenine-specific) n=1 Tax=Simplicispira suum TaxID=2109915 RepID=A0A2S0MZ68_9BURK|nr:SAM-dependent methyltransferase [Simplicispira suum]AVO41179.1 SAM-dependent methyltransferase [Simplicispira suum]
MQAFNQEHLKNYRFKHLFNELGWDAPAQQQPYSVTVGEATWLLDVVALKKGVQVLHCQPGAQGQMPDYATRQKIERKVTPDVREHLIVFSNGAKTIQVWQWVTRQTGKPAQYREVFFRQGEAPELLTQKLSRLHFALDEEELLTVLGVTARLDDAAPRDKVTKKFYTAFEAQRKAFAAFIDGIPNDSEDQRWYTAVVIDRLMFLWFLQEKSFLNGQTEYLQLRLQAHLDGNHGQSFYKRFLSPLFFKGFAQERTPETAAAIHAEFGNVPYLNGGLFAQHELEQRYGEALDIADSAFQKLFAFFDEWEWHLDERPLKSGREINPDVLGYIFEKFVNQKQMGAYYTKEDITEYIGKNTIIPALLGKVRAEHPAAFDALAWPLLQQSGDAYLYPAMLKGVDMAYPPEVENGLDTQMPNLLARRKPWNKRADEAVSLPTEIWRETIARHQRTREVRAKLAAGELTEVGDLITYNLNIRQFAQDLIEGCTDVALLKSFWFNLAGRMPRQSNEKFRHGLSVLDPTCGSGAFLFSALGILKPLYDATLRTLQAVRSDALIAGEKSSPEKWAEVDELLARFAATGSERAQDYAVIKHIIVHNLYGVDIEKQATEIAKLRLFLKLVALLEPDDAIEPLPDIDFNIRHGNTLVGYATADETEKAVKGATQGNLFSDAWEDIRIRLTAVEQQYNNFQIQQVQRGGHVSAADKQALVHTLGELEEMLNFHLAREYGVNTTNTKDFEIWKKSHQPFHWYVDFYPLMAGGGFACVVGNPPFVEIRPSNVSYILRGYETIGCGNLYAPIVERCTVLACAGWLGLVTPMSLLCTDRTVSLRGLMSSQNNWISSYDMRPSSLFEGVAQRLCLLISSHADESGSTASGGYRRWSSEERTALLDTTWFARLSIDHFQGATPWPKISHEVEKTILGSLVGGGVVAHLSKNSPPIYVHRIVRYFVKALNKAPLFVDAQGVNGKSDDYKALSVDPQFSDVILACLNSSIFYWYWRLTSDGFHCGYGDIYRFPFDGSSLLSYDTEISELVKLLMVSFEEGSVKKSIATKAGRIFYQEFSPKGAKSILDEIDGIIATSWGLNPEMVDHIINYDIKYRMGFVGDAGDD